MTTTKVTQTRRRNAEIWSLHEKGETAREIGKKFNLTPTSVYQIVSSFKKMLNEAPESVDHATRQAPSQVKRNGAYADVKESPEYKALALRYHTLKMFLVQTLMEDSSSFVTSTIREASSLLKPFMDTSNTNVQ